MKLINYIISDSIINQLRSFKNNFYTSKKINYEELLVSNNEGYLDGDRIVNTLLPPQHKEIFISHSHLDIDIVKKLARHIEKETNLGCFIDSEVWGNVDELQEKWDAIAVDEDWDFTSAVVLNHATNTRMILATSLLEAIKNCKYFIFLNTNNSGKMIEESKIKITSPWIYYELNVAKTFADRHYHIIDESIQNRMQHSVPLKEFKKITKYNELIKYIND